jgi:hypothetical protein
MKNQYGLECPLSWGDIDVDHNWVSMDANGEIWSHRYKPVLIGSQWFSFDFFELFVNHIGSLPADFKKCLWKRPKTQSE